MECPGRGPYLYRTLRLTPQNGRDSRPGRACTGTSGFPRTAFKKQGFYDVTRRGPHHRDVRPFRKPRMALRFARYYPPVLRYLIDENCTLWISHIQNRCLPASPRQLECGIAFLFTRQAHIHLEQELP